MLYNHLESQSPGNSDGLGLSWEMTGDGSGSGLGSLVDGSPVFGFIYLDTTLYPGVEI